MLYLILLTEFAGYVYWFWDKVKNEAKYHKKNDL